MATFASPYGLVPVNKQGFAPVNGGTQRGIRVTADVATAFYVGQVVTLNTAGGLTAGGAAGPNLAGTTRLIGVVTGIEFTPPGGLVGQVQDGYLPANATTAGYTGITVFVNDDPNQLYMVQSDGVATLTAAAVGKNFALVNGNSGSTSTKQSTSALASTGGGATASASTCLRAVAIVDLGNQYCDVIVRWLPSLHAYESATGATT